MDLTDYYALAFLIFLTQAGFVFHVVASTDKRCPFKAPTKKAFFIRLIYLIPVLGATIMILEVSTELGRKFINHWNNLPDQ